MVHADLITSVEFWGVSILVYLVWKEVAEKLSHSVMADDSSLLEDRCKKLSDNKIEGSLVGLLFNVSRGYLANLDVNCKPQTS